MNPPNTPAQPEFDELWILRDEHSNRALIRSGGEKWHDDVKGEPSEKWMRIIAFSAYAQLAGEIERLRAEVERVRHDFCAMSDRIDVARSEAIALAETYKQERDALLAQATALAEALEKTKEVIRYWHGECAGAWDIYEQHSPEMKPYRDVSAAWRKFRGGDE